jgi:hypothetical protein
VSLFVAAATANAADKPSASGSFTYNDKKYAPAHAIAFKEGSFIKVVMSDKPFDTKWAGDGVYDESELMAHPSASFTITIMPEHRELFGVRYRDDKGSGADFRCENPERLKLEKMDESVVAGSFKCEETDVTFAAPMLAAAAK